ncbi:uncharacterized protein J4E84_010676 [Alternaria hordeiaustralica]|uniref:uncharacterized protein n=1 Tax=Alternaria hordeiaustralica TaxID=1187925 RepID=UPI0020C39495|nr:uncharacterized protein J4E84_010676 [Alternaria hordeiaustralica]KAI4674301.1 hypothetical protein J4E84_010676 [Alternaria hordeiaustralica]
MTERVAKPRGRKKKETTRAALAVRGKESTDDGQPSAIPRTILAQNEAASTPTPIGQPSSSSYPALPSESRDNEKIEQAIVAIRYQYRPPMLNQPSRILPEALDTAFLSHYIELNKGGSQYAPEIQWLGHINQIHSNARKPAVRLSLRAVSMAFFGKHHHDPSILIDSWRWYTVALSAQRTSIARLKNDAIPDEEEVLVPLIMSLYELYVGATATGAMSHIAAAAEIMNMRGPSNCGSGAIWPLFKGIRSSDAHKSVVFNRKSVYASHDWMTLPFIGKPRDAHQTLADIELMVPHCFAMLEIPGSMRVLFSTPIPSHVDVRPCKELACKLIRQLDDWAAAYPHLTNLSRSPRGGTPVERGTSTLPKPNTRQGSPKSTTSSPNTFIALIASNYMADRLVLSMLMYKTHTESTAPIESHEMPTPYYFDVATKATTDIIEAAAEIEQAQTPGFDLLRSIAPVMAVAFAAPTMGLRKDAVDTMTRWARRIGGLGSIIGAI